MENGTNVQQPQEPQRPQSDLATSLSRVFDLLECRKTYLITACGIVYLIGGDAGWWPVNPQILGILGFGAIAALRRGLQRPGPTSSSSQGPTT